MTPSQPKLSRRHFLLAAAAGTAAGAASTMTPKERDLLPPDPSGAQPGKGYRITAHVRNYYRTAKI